MANGERRKKAFRILIIPFSLLCFFIYLYFSVGLNTIGEVFSTLNYKFFVLAFVSFTLALIFEQFRIYLARRHYQKKFPYWYEVHATLTSNFWEALTPGTFAFGPVNHVSVMNKQGIPPSKGTTIILYNGICGFVAWVVSTVMYTAINFNFYIVGVRWYLVVLYIAGLVVNTVTIFIYVYVPRHTRFTGALVKGVLNLLRKLRIIRKEERYNNLLIKTEDQIQKLKKNISELSYKPYEWILSIFLCMVQIFAVYATNYFLALSLGVTGVDVFKFVGAFLIISSITILFPVPGALGIQDVTLQLILYPLFALSSVDVAHSVDFLMVFNRIVTYYYPLLLGAIALAIKTPTIKSGKCSICEGYTIIEDTSKSKAFEKNEVESVENETEENSSTDSPSEDIKENNN